MNLLQKPRRQSTSLKGAIEESPKTQKKAYSIILSLVPSSNFSFSFFHLLENKLECALCLAELKDFFVENTIEKVPRARLLMVTKMPLKVDYIHEIIRFCG